MAAEREGEVVLGGGGQEMACNNEIFIYSTHILAQAKRACMWKPIKCFSEIKAPDDKKKKKRRPPEGFDL